jgi:DNA polymerase/3'-5' exonuclease PolX
VAVGEEILVALAPACRSAQIAGSVRRGEPHVKDLEIVYIPQLVEQRVDLFTTGQVPATERCIRALVEAGFWAFDAHVRRDGPRHKRMIIDRGQPLTVELYRADAENWGYILALRTGPAAFNRLWAAKPWAGGVLPTDVALRDGQLWRGGKHVPTPTEKRFFQEIGLPYWPPHERSAKRIRAHTNWINLYGSDNPVYQT